MLPAYQPHRSALGHRQQFVNRHRPAHAPARVSPYMFGIGRIQIKVRTRRPKGAQFPRQAVNTQGIGDRTYPAQRGMPACAIRVPHDFGGVRPPPGQSDSLGKKRDAPYRIRFSGYIQQGAFPIRHPVFFPTHGAYIDDVGRFINHHQRPTGQRAGANTLGTGHLNRAGRLGGEVVLSKRRAIAEQQERSAGFADRRPWHGAWPGVGGCGVRCPRLRWPCRATRPAHPDRSPGEMLAPCPGRISRCAFMVSTSITLATADRRDLPPPLAQLRATPLFYRLPLKGGSDYSALP